MQLGARLPGTTVVGLDVTLPGMEHSASSPQAVICVLVVCGAVKPVIYEYQFCTHLENACILRSTVYSVLEYHTVHIRAD